MRNFLVIGLSLISIFVSTLSACGSDGDNNGQTGDICGGTSGIQCSSSLYCKFPDGSCGASHQTGVCTETPEICTTDYNPVCGCDGTTYPNACSAAVSGVSIRANGPCTQN